MSSTDQPAGPSEPGSSGQPLSPRITRHQTQIPPQVLQQADDAAAAAAARAPRNNRSLTAPDLRAAVPIEHVPPPPYSARKYGQIDIAERGMDTGARVARDGRVDINISSKNKKLTKILRNQMHPAPAGPAPEPEPEIPEGLGLVGGLPPPPMNIVIQIVGSRGDVQPFVALGLVLKNKYNHRVRIATHPTFKKFVTENGLEFFSIGGDPAELMAFMVKNPGLMPGFESIRAGDIGKRRKGVYEMINGCWRSCIESGDGTGAPEMDDILEDESDDSGIGMDDPAAKPFVADAIIANPPSFAHIHIAEKLGIPLHLMFTMPWSPTQAFPHPLANVVSSNTDAAMSNFLSYILVDLLTWQGLGDVVNRFRERTLRLEPLSVIWAPGNLHRLRIPWTYCWSPALIPKPEDWLNNIDISGFYFLNLATNFTPEPELEAFLNAGPPPVYIGFGSIVIEDPNAMTELIFEAVKKTGQRALVSKGWGGLSADEMGLPDNIYMIGNCPHDWLFKKVSCVVHHGGAGTTAAGVAAGRPTVIVPFFGDQQFWGQMCHRAGAGPEPIPHKELTADTLADAINFALRPDVLDRAKEMSDKIKMEKGTESGAKSFHRHLAMSSLRCSILPERVAVWQFKKTGLRLSALAASTLANEGLLEFSDLRLYRSREYVPDTGPPEPISGGAAALIGTIGTITAGVADYPTEILRSFKTGAKGREDEGEGEGEGDDDKETEEKEKKKEKENEGESPERASATARDLTQSESIIPEEVAESAQSGEAVVSHVSTSSSEATATAAAVAPVETEHRSLFKISSSRFSPVLGPIRSRSRAQSDADRTGSPRGLSSLRPEQTRSSGKLSPGGSRSATPKGRDRSSSFGRAGQITMDSLIGSARATANIVGAGMKSPFDFTFSIAQGFHNAPKLYGDKTVRATEKVTGISSGLKAAGKEFGYGFYDGISGLVTQPLQGAKEEGIAGFGKGLLRGSFGLILKPGAAIWGLPGYTMKGVYAEIVKNFGKSTFNYIIAARTAQGFEDWQQSSEADRKRILTAWKSEPIQATAFPKRGSNKSKVTEGDQSRFYGEDGQLLKGYRATKHLSFDDRKELEKMRKDGEKLSKSTNKEPSGSEDATVHGVAADLAHTTDDEFEQAIRAAVQQTSKNDPEEDARIERAIRASVREFRRRARPDVPGSPAEDNETLVTAPAASAEEPDKAQTGPAVRGRSPGPATDDDEELRNAIEASMQLNASNSTSQNNPTLSLAADEPPPQYQIPTKSPVYRTPAEAGASADMPPTDEKDLLRALQASEDEAKQREVELEKQRIEEEVVLEYVKKQSLAEEEYRRKMETTVE